MAPAVFLDDRIIFFRRRTMAAGYPGAMIVCRYSGIDRFRGGKVARKALKIWGGPLFLVGQLRKQ